MTCQAVTFSNCKTYTIFDQCTACLPGYYLKEGLCHAYPLPVVYQCSRYSTLTTCIQCNNGFHLFLSTRCVINTVITNCSTYSTTTATTTCTICRTGFYVSNNVCQARVNSANITNCKTYTSNNDTCAECNTNYVLTDDKRLCLSAVSSCATYASSTYLSTALTCASCNNGFYLVTENSVTRC